MKNNAILILSMATFLVAMCSCDCVCDMMHDVRERI